MLVFCCEGLEGFMPCMQLAHSLAGNQQVTEFTFCCSVLDSGLGDPFGISTVGSFPRLFRRGSGD